MRAFIAAGLGSIVLTTAGLALSAPSGQAGNPIPALLAPASAMAATVAVETALPTQPQIVLASATAVPELPEPAGVAAVKDEREPIICIFWAIQRVAEAVGAIDEDQPRVSDTAYPVPVPVWVFNSIMGDRNGNG